MRKFWDALAASAGRNLGLILVVLSFAASMVVFVHEWRATSRSDQRKWDDALTEMAQLREDVAVGGAERPGAEEWRDAVEGAVDEAVRRYAEERRMTVADFVQAVGRIRLQVARWAPGDVNKRWRDARTGEWEGYSMRWITTQPDAAGGRVAIAYAMHYTEGPRAGEWTTGVLPFRVRATVTRIKAETGEYTYAVEFALAGDPNKGPEELRGAEWRVPVAAEDVRVVISPGEVEAVENPTPPPPQERPAFRAWAPHVGFAAGGGAFMGDGGIAPTAAFGLTFTPFGWGLTRNDLKWEFLGVGADYLPQAERFSLTLMPASWRPFDSFVVNTRWQFLRLGWIPTGGWYAGTALSLDF